MTSKARETVTDKVTAYRETNTAAIPRITLNVTEAATATGLSVDTIKAAIRRGELPARRSGRLKRDSNKGNAGDPAGRYLIRIKDLEAWIDGLEDAS